MILINSTTIQRATARVSFQKLEELDIEPGSYVKIYSEPTKVHFCSLWPSDINNNHIVINPKTTLEITTDSMDIDSRNTSPQSIVQLITNSII
jgi:hypothetical protein